MSREYDVIVVGAGSMGSAACSHLARRGVRVLGLDRFELPHVFGSHHGESRMIRQAYYEHPDYVPLLRRAYTLWDALSDESGEPLLHRTGGLYAGPADGSIVSGSVRAAREHGLAHELLDGALLRERFPRFAFPESWTGFFEEEAGFLLPERCVAAHVNSARRNGAVIRTGEPILSWSADRHGARVRTPGLGTIHAERLVFTAGAWTAALLHELGVRLSVTRQVLAWFDAGDRADELSLAAGFPCWFMETDPPFGHYGFPVADPRSGLKIALHKPGEPIDPDGASGPEHKPREHEIEDLREVLRRHLPVTGGRVISACTCLYTNSPDHHFILGLHPGHHDRVIVAAGFSGHGFKFASVVGEILADLAVRGTTPHPIGFLSPDRFG